MKTRTAVIVGAILLASLTRVIPHPPNFAPITAMALFGAATLKSRKLALVTPLIALFVSDLAIEGLYRLGLRSGWALDPGMWVTYTAFLAITVLGFVLRRHHAPVAVAGITLASSCFFFVFTNFAVWARGVLYPQTAEGLLLCYTAAIPFFHNTLLGDAVYATALFGGFALATRRVASLREPTLYPAVGGKVS